MTDDDLLALARKATQGEWVCVGPGADAGKTLPLQWQHRYEIRTPDTAPTDKHSWPYRIAQTIEGQSSPQHGHDFAYIATANPSAIIAMLERYRAERNGFEIVREQMAATIARHVEEKDALRAEVERLTRERDEARSWNSLYNREPHEAKKKAIALRAANWEHGCACQFDEDDEQILWCSPHAELKQRAEAAESALVAMTRERDEAYKLIYVPGLWECAKCGCNLVVTEIHADTGAMRASKEPQRCPNDCGPMWRKTERKAGNELVDRLDAEITKRHAAESALAAAQKRVGVLDAVLKECEEYFDNRADADGDSDGFHPNEEMRLLVEVRDALKESGNGDETVRPDQRGKDGD